MAKEKWSKGKEAGCVVSDTPNRHNEDADHVEYYGGYLVAESIPKQEYVNLIATAPDLLEACENCLLVWGSNSASVDPDEVCAMLQAAIDKAKGKEIKTNG